MNINIPAGQFSKAMLFAALLASGAVNASTISLVSGDFVTPNPPTSGNKYNSMTFADSGVTSSAIAGYFNGTTYTENAGSGYPKLGWWSGNGIGVYSASDDYHTIDNKGVFDYVHFTFSEAVAVQSVTITCLSCDLNPGADAAYLVGALGGTWTEVGGPSGNSLPSSYTFNLDLSTYDADFRFGASQIITQVAYTDSVDGNASNGATCHKYNKVKIDGEWVKGTADNGATCKEYDDVEVTKYKSQYDDFKIKSISFLTCTEGNCTPPPEECIDCGPAEVPEPSSLSLLGLGALALVARTRRRKV